MYVAIVIGWVLALIGFMYSLYKYIAVLRVWSSSRENSIINQYLNVRRDSATYDFLTDLLKIACFVIPLLFLTFHY